jgi:hypothetical protein
LRNARPRHLIRFRNQTLAVELEQVSGAACRRDSMGGLSCAEAIFGAQSAFYICDDRVKFARSLQLTGANSFA